MVSLIDRMSPPEHFQLLFHQCIGGGGGERGPLPQHICSQAWLCSGSGVKIFGAYKRQPTGTSVPGAVQSWAH